MSRWRTGSLEVVLVCEVRVKHHLPWRPAVRAGVRRAALVHRVCLRPGNADVWIAVQESQDREGHIWPACRGRTEMEEQLEMPGAGPSTGANCPPLEKATQEIWASVDAGRHLPPRTLPGTPTTWTLHAHWGQHKMTQMEIRFRNRTSCKRIYI